MRFIWLLLGLFISGGLVAAEPIRLKLPAPARHLAANETSGVLAASMALDGIGFLPIDAAGQDSLVHRESACLGAEPYGEGFLAAGRFGSLLRFAGNGANLAITERIETEGVPVDLLATHGRIIAALGPAGLAIYDYQPGEEAQLRARYPFVDYTKRVLMRGDYLFLADNFDTGLQILHQGDLFGPRRVFQQPLGFVDDVALHSDFLAVAVRLKGTVLYHIGNPESPRELLRIPLRQTTSGDSRVRQVLFSPGGDLLICEASAGARLLRLAMVGDSLKTETLQEKAGGTSALSAAFLPNKRLAIASEEGDLTIVELPDQ